MSNTITETMTFNIEPHHAMAVWELVLVVEVAGERVVVDTKTIQTTDGPEPAKPTLDLLKIFFRIHDVSAITTGGGGGAEGKLHES